MLGSRKVRVAAAIFVIASVANLLWPRATSYVSTTAMINAPVLAVRAPFNGVLTGASADVGVGIPSGGRILSMDRAPVSLNRRSERWIATRQISASSISRREQPIVFQPIAPANSVIWTASPQRGASIHSGELIAEMLDCERRFVDALFGERAFHGLAPGSTAHVRLRGGQRSLKAVIVARHATGGGAAAMRNAAAHPSTKYEGLRVLLRLPAVDVANADVARRFCDVGRAAEVRVTRPRASRISVAVRAWAHEIVSWGRSPPRNAD